MVKGERKRPRLLSQRIVRQNGAGGGERKLQYEPEKEEIWEAGGKLLEANLGDCGRNEVGHQGWRGKNPSGA